MTAAGRKRSTRPRGASPLYVAVAVAVTPLVVWIGLRLTGNGGLGTVLFLSVGIPALLSAAIGFAFRQQLGPIGFTMVVAGLVGLGTLFFIAYGLARSGALE